MVCHPLPPPIPHDLLMSEVAEDETLHIGYGWYNFDPYIETEQEILDNIDEYIEKTYGFTALRVIYYHADEWDLFVVRTIEEGWVALDRSLAQDQYGTRRWQQLGWFDWGVTDASEIAEMLLESISQMEEEREQAEEVWRYGNPRPIGYTNYLKWSGVSGVPASINNQVV